MTRVSAIALNTFREAIRNKVLYLLVLFAVLLIAGSISVGNLSMHEDVRVIRDIGLGGIELFGDLIAIFVGVVLVYKELDKKTVYALIPKPMHRWEFVFGKYVGMVLTLAVQVAIMAAVLFIVLFTRGQSIGELGPVARAIVLLFDEVVVITAIAILFSTFSSPILSGAYTLGIAMIGHFTVEIRELIVKLSSEAARRACAALLKLVPDLHLFYVSGSMLDGHYVTVHADYVDWSYVVTASAYGLAYAACALAIGMIVFARRDFT